MYKRHERHSIYRACLHLYPKSHRQAYGQQMVQTLDDMLSDQRSAFGRLAVWLRICVELPVNAIEENISKFGGISVMKLTKITPKQYLYAFFGTLLIGSYAILGISLIAQHNQNKILGGRIDNAEQSRRGTSGGGYIATSIVPGEGAVYLPLARLKLADTRLNDTLVYSYRDTQPSPDSERAFPATVSISTHGLSTNNFPTAQFDCAQVVYADFAVPSYPVNPSWKSNGSVALADGRTMNVYYAPDIEGCSHSWKTSHVDSKAIADSLKQAVSY